MRSPFFVLALRVALAGLEAEGCEQACTGFIVSLEPSPTSGVACLQHGLSTPCLHDVWGQGWYGGISVRLHGPPGKPPLL